MKRHIVSAFLLVLLANPAHAHDVAASCKVTRTLVPGTELQTIHANILCLHHRIDLMRVGFQPLLGSKPGHMVITLPNLPPEQHPYVIRNFMGANTNPCGRDAFSNKLMCQSHLVRSFQELCKSGDCVEGLENWRAYMSHDWLEYVDTRELDSEINITTLLDKLPNMPHLFESHTTGQLLDMSKFFQEISPTTAFVSR